MPRWAIGSDLRRILIACIPLTIADHRETASPERLAVVAEDGEEIGEVDDAIEDDVRAHVVARA